VICRCCTALLYGTAARLLVDTNMVSDLGALGGTRTPNLLIRRNSTVPGPARQYGSAPCGRVTNWPRLLNRIEAITALTLAERLLSAHSADSPCAIARRGGAERCLIASSGSRSPWPWPSSQQCCGHLLPSRLRTRHLSGEYGLTARLVPFTVDGLILAASMPWPAPGPPWRASGRDRSR
jgi:hypothetical protein